MAVNYWQLNGNGNTDPSADYVGTRDSQPLVLRTSNVECLRIDPAGNLGIGTTAPAYPVHLSAGKALRVEGGSGPTDSVAYFSFGGYGSFGIDAPGIPSGRFVVQNDGQVRVGPDGSLGVDLRAAQSEEVLTNGLFLASAKSGAVGIHIQDPNPAYGLHLGPETALRIEGGSNVGDPAAYLSLGGYGTFSIDTPSVAGGRFVVEGSGNIGIGIPSPAFGVHVAQGKALRIEGGSSPADDASYFSFGGFGAFSIDAPGIAAGRFVVHSSGNVGIGTPDPSSRLHVVGDITVTGDVLLTGADCAERFELSAGADPPEPGTVLVLGDRGGTAASQRAYDHKVVGVVSGAGAYKPGIVLDTSPGSAAGRVTVALAGKVYCKVDAQYAPVAVGDLLTTSPTPGHAMKATDPGRAFGCVVGKALEALERDKGLVPIVVALQ